MFRKILAILALLPLVAAAQQAITIKAPPDTFSVNSTAQATVTKNGPFLEVSIRQHTIWASKKYANQSQVVSYSAAIATTDANGQWSTVRASEEQATPLTLTPGDTKEIPAKKLLIPIDEINGLSNYWIVLTTKVRAPQSKTGYGYTYARSEKLKLAND